MTDAWNADHVRRVLTQRAPDIEIRFFDASTATSQLAADQIGCELGQIAKSIVFFVEDQPVVVVTSGDQRVDDRGGDIRKGSTGVRRRFCSRSTIGRRTRRRTCRRTGRTRRHRSGP